MKTSSRMMLQGSRGRTGWCRRWRRRWRIFWTRQQGEGWTVAAVAVDGDDGLRLGGRWRESREGEGGLEREERIEGAASISQVWLEAPGRHAGAGGGVVGRAHAGTQLLLLLAGGRRRCCPCGLGQNRSWARQVSQVRPFPLSVLFLLFCFLLFKLATV